MGKNTKKENIDYLKEVLTKMCEMVGADYDNIDFKKDRWFMDYSWDKKQEFEFNQWLVTYLQNKPARMALFNTTISSKQYIQKLADHFCFNSGWRYKKDDEDM